MVLQLIEADLQPDVLVGVVRENGQILFLRPTLSTPGTFYQSIWNNGVPVPQEPAFNIINGTVGDTPGVSTNLTLQYQTIFGGDGGALPQQPGIQFSSDFSLVDEPIFPATRVNAPGIQIAQAAAVAANANANTRQITATQTYFVIPGLAVDALPYFSTIQAAINAVPSTFAVYTIVLPNSGTFTENLTIPPTVIITIRAAADPSFFGPELGGDPTIVGNVVDNGVATAQTILEFDGVQLTGNITLTSAPVGQKLFFTGGSITGNINAPNYEVYLTGRRPPNSLGIVGATSYPQNMRTSGFLSGGITSCLLVSFYNYGKNGTAAVTATQAIELNGIQLISAVTWTASAINLLNCPVRSAQTFVGTVRCDAFTHGWLILKGATITGSLTLFGSGSSKPVTAFAASVAATNLNTAVEPAGFYRVTVNLIKTAGTAGVATFNLTGTDSFGSFTTAVAVLDVAAVNRSSGTALIHSTGAAHITFAIPVVGGVAFGATYEVVLEKLDSQVL